MAIYGYARVSTIDQDLRIQEAALTAAGCTIIRAEKKSGASKQGRTELNILLDFLLEGDILVVTRVDRLARSVGDLQDIVRLLKKKSEQELFQIRRLDGQIINDECPYLSQANNRT